MDTIVKAPIRFKPYLKSVIWGGDNICKFKDIPQPEPSIGESWEISAVPGHVSVVDGGVYDGLSLTELIDRYGESLLGQKVIGKYGRVFPLLVKIIDAADNLSVQVHPDDALARARHGCLGKTEMWYIIDAARGAKIYAGLNQAITPQIYRQKVADGTFTDIIATHDSRPGDVFFLPAGRVHAIGAGNLLAEIQESSDITYRIFDYGRRDAAGNTRELHTELAADAIDYTVHDHYKFAPAAAADIAEIVACNHFKVDKVVVDGTLALAFDPASFTLVMCVDGAATLQYAGGDTPLRRGQTVLLPAALCEITAVGKGTLIAAQV
ncbi:MAG: class I mannose-6-phosphate isomerase [Bacteroides sp.]|nr:class I mannose-6-phosphate isomerase [Bacteroides sp.]MCM1095267.1 class I mannose-6-phosphate isomerase [Terasakiella sp.]